MGIVRLNLAQTVDGYISRLDGTVDFLPEMSEDLGDSFTSFLNSIDVIVMGRTTYEEYKSYGYEMYGEKEIIVWTTRPHDQIGNISFYTGKISDLIAKFEGNNIWCFGGTKLILEFLKDSLIDEFHITTVPYVLGSGKRLFAEGISEFGLRYLSSSINDEMVTTIYEVIKQ